MTREAVRRSRRLPAMRLAVLALAAAGAAALLSEGAASEARFAVTDRVVNPDLPAVAVTIEPVGNGVRLVSGGGFEPAVYRTQFLAMASHPSRILATRWIISAGGRLRSGALDGADVRIYRIRNGAMTLVRRDRVAPDGFVAEGWSRLTRNRALPASTSELPLAWETRWRPGARTWFRVRALDAQQRLSPPSAAVEAVSPQGAEAEAARRRKDYKALKAAGAKIEGGLREDEADLPAPASVQIATPAEGAPRLSWAPVPGATGYVVERTSYPPQTHRRPYIALEGGESGAPIEAGDLVILSRRFLEVSRERLGTDAFWGARTSESLRPRPLRHWPEEPGGAPWRLRPHAPDTPVTDPGETYLELDLQPGKPVSLSGEGFSRDNQHWYEVLRPEPYRVEAWVRSDAPGVARLEATGGAAWTRRQRPVEFVTGPQWTHISAEFVGDDESLSARGNFALTVEGEGVFGVDNLRIRRAHVGWLDFSPEQYARLREARVSALRMHPLIKTGADTYDLAQLTAAPGLTSGTTGGSSLPQMLRMAEGAGADPWLQIEPHLAPEEWDGLLEYLAAPAGAGPWADKRVRQGRKAPWTDAFDEIWIELGNETWNGIFRPWTFPEMTDAATGRSYGTAEVYGLYQAMVIARLRASPWWRKAGLEEKVGFPLGGWNINGYGETAARRSPRSGWVGMGPYIGGWDADQPLPTGTPENFAGLLNWVTQNTRPLGESHMRRAAKVARYRGAPLEVGTYEAGPGYVLRGLDPERALIQEQVMKSQAAGVATLDNFLALAELGYRRQTFFAFGEGRFWRTHARWYEGGQAYPSWKLLSLFNREGLGDMLAVETRAVPGRDLPKARRREAVSDAPQVAAYATRRGDRLNLFLISRRLPDYPAPPAGTRDPGCTPVEVALPFASAEALSVHRMDGPYSAHNVDADRVGVEVERLAPPADPARFRLGPETGAPACGLPPASAYLYVFEGIEG